MKRRKVLISYSHKDKRWKDRLVTHLRVFEDRLDVWDDQRIGAGEDWEVKIDEAMSEARVAILMVSADFLTSDFILRKEVPRLLERQGKDGLCVFPVIVRPCSWRGVKWLSKMQVRPGDDKDLEAGNRHQQEQKLTAVAYEVAGITAKMVQKERPPTKGTLQFCSPQERLEEYLQSLKDAMLRKSILRWKLFHWHLFALPISCKQEMSPAKSQRPISCERLLERGDRLILLLGAPACGKTTACSRFKAKPPKTLIPVDISKRLPCTRKEALAPLANGEAVDDQQSGHDLECDGRLLFIADGIGEIRKVAKVITSLNRLVAELPHSRFLVTCRTGDFDYQANWLPQFQKWKILDLNKQAQDKFLKTQPDELRRRVLRAFSAKPQLRKICRNQFLLLVAVRLLADEQVDLTPTRVGLYESFLEDFLERWHSLRPGARTYVTKILQELAVEMRRSPKDRTSLPMDHVWGTLHRCLHRARSEDVTEQLYDLYHLGLIEKSDGGVRFFQETFQEYLCARWLFDNFGKPSENDVIWSFWEEIAGLVKR